MKTKQVIILALLALTGCSTPATKGWTYMGSCPVDGFPCMINNSLLIGSSSSHPYGGMAMSYNCINPDFVHNYVITNWYPLKVEGIPVYKP